MQSPTVVIDLAAKRLVIERSYSSPQAKVWRAWTNAELLAKWWGPETWPASSASFDFRVGGHWHYYMTGPDGTQAWGKLEYTEIRPTELLCALDYFSDAAGAKSSELPESRWRVEFRADGPAATRLVTTISFENEADVQRLIDMGFEQGYVSALSNLEKLLATL